MPSGEELCPCKEQATFPGKGPQGKLGKSTELLGFPPDHITVRSAPGDCCPRCESSPLLPELRESPWGRGQKGGSHVAAGQDCHLYAGHRRARASNAHTPRLFCSISVPTVVLRPGGLRKAPLSKSFPSPCSQVSEAHGHYIYLFPSPSPSQSETGPSTLG